MSSITKGWIAKFTEATADLEDLPPTGRPTGTLVREIRMSTTTSRSATLSADVALLQAERIPTSLRVLVRNRSHSVVSAAAITAAVGLVAIPLATTRAAEERGHDSAPPSQRSG